MFVKPMNKPVKPVGPPGCNPLRNEDRMPVLKVVSGDTWMVDAELVAADGGPASPKNSYVEFVLSENQFSPPIWTGVWVNGVLMDANRPGLVHVLVPRDVTKALRRGSYMFSLRVSDPMKFSFSTQLSGNFLVEYMPTSDQHSIPYRDGTSEIFGGGTSTEGTAGSGGDSGGGSGGGGGGGGGTPSGEIYVPDPKTGLYHKLTVVLDSDGNVTLNVAAQGVKL